VPAEVLSCCNVSVSWEPDAPPVLADVTFSMAEGERVALVGLNGSGKTTLLLALAGLLPHQGEVRICGERLTRGSAAALRDSLGFLFNVPEDQLLLPKVLDDVAFGLTRRGAPAAEAALRAQDALDRMGVGHLAQLPVHRLSHGQKQRVALAGALVAEPPLMLLDEPSSGLDPPAAASLAELLCGLISAQLTATHDLDLADRASTRVLLIDQGTVALDSRSTSAVRERWGLAPVARCSA
jgi:cobalt/nickel transport system ATP-binding protein